MNEPVLAQVSRVYLHSLVDEGFAIPKPPRGDHLENRLAEMIRRLGKHVHHTANQLHEKNPIPQKIRATTLEEIRAALAEQGLRLGEPFKGGNSIVPSDEQQWSDEPAEFLAISTGARFLAPFVERLELCSGGTLAYLYCEEPYERLNYLTGGSIEIQFGCRANPAGP